MDGAARAVDNAARMGDLPMSEPDEIRFACIGCGAMNPVDAASCSGCGHAFGGPVAAAPSESLAPPPPHRPSPEPNPYEPPAAQPPLQPTFRIGTAMLLVAAVATCLGAFAADVGLGACLAIGLIPATVRMAVVSVGRGPDGRPRTTAEALLSFILTFFVSYLILLASAIAFGVTCFPIGVASDSPLFALGAGGLAALIAGAWLTRVAVRAARRDFETKRRHAEAKRRYAGAKRHDSQIYWK